MAQRSAAAQWESGLCMYYVNVETVDLAGDELAIGKGITSCYGLLVYTGLCLQDYSFLNSGFFAGDPTSMASALLEVPGIYVRL